MFVLRLFVVGLIAFVPNKNHTAVTVLLMKNSEHFPHIIVEQEHLIRWTETSPNTCDAKDEFFQWDLDGEDIVLTRSSVTTQLAIANTVKKTSGGAIATALPKNKFESQDFGWIPRMSDVRSKAGDIDGSFLDSDPKVPIIARYVAREGSLGIFRMSEFQNKVPVFKFKDGSSTTITGPEQALSDVVMIEVEIDDPVNCDIGILLSKFDGSSSRYLAIGPNTGDCSEGGVVDVLLTNSPPKCQTRQECSDPVASHFKYYYDLSKNRANFPDLKRAVPFVSGGSGFSYPKDVESLEIPRVMVGRDTCEPVTSGANNRPICTFVTFNAANF